MGAIKGGTRRKHSDEFKAQVMASCRQPGASVAGVARVHQLNANLVSIWLRQAKDRLVHPHGGADMATDVSPRPVAVWKSLHEWLTLELRRVAAAGRPRLPTRLMVALLYLKHAFNESDEEVVQRWGETPKSRNPFEFGVKVGLASTPPSRAT